MAAAGRVFLLCARARAGALNAAAGSNASTHQQNAETSPIKQLVEELLTFWSLEDYETTLEELEEVLIVSAYY